MVRTFRFRNFKDAQKKQREIRRSFRFTPRIFRERNPMSGKTIFVVVQDEGLVPVNVRRPLDF